MGFFDGAMKAITGGSDSSSKSSSQSGFSQLPSVIRGAYKDFGRQVRGLLSDPASFTSAFTPLGQTADETAGIQAIRAGFAPTQQSITSDIAMQMNPYNDSVISTINREANGQNSILRQTLNSAGQFGSNRSILGANDIDLTRANQIGTFLSDQYNTSLNNALTTLPSARAADANGLMGIGSFQRGLDSQTNQAQYSALSAIGALLGVLPTDGGSTSTGSSTASSVGGVQTLLPW